jgi:hypothetical protein
MPKVIRAISTPELDPITGDAANAYPRELGLRRFVRHLLFLKPNVLIVADEIELEKAGDLELRFHPEQARAERSQNAFLFRSNGANLRLHALATDGLDMEAGPVAAEGRHGEKDQSMFTVRLRTRRAQWRNAAVLSWAPAASEPPKASLKVDGDTWVFQVEGRAVLLNWSNGNAEVRR